MKEMMVLNRKEQRMLVVLNQVEGGRMRGREASEVLGLSLRHVRRLLAAYREEGAQAFARPKGFHQRPGFQPEPDNTELGI